MNNIGLTLASSQGEESGSNQGPFPNNGRRTWQFLLGDISKLLWVSAMCLPFFPFLMGVFVLLILSCFYDFMLDMSREDELLSLYVSEVRRATFGTDTDDEILDFEPDIRIQ
ncbi:hypothetical protein H1C71_027215 [Ictidomys tridecemlineatus]|nr:hypothetical protein H1C71_027215 [Ictidomys tridecemlineatus]